MNSKKWLTILCGSALLISFFLPWVNWDGSKVTGYALATGDFFKISEAKLDLDNPFPKLSFTFYIFWLIPVLAAATIFLTATNRKTGLLIYITGALSISLASVYIVFTNFAVGKELFEVMSFAIWLHILAAIGLIVFSTDAALLKKAGWIIAGPVFVFTSFKLTEKYIMNETHKETVDVKAAYTIGAAELINEFTSNDSVANKKYLEQVLIVNGNTAGIELLADSTSTIKFADSTGSYAIFSLEKNQLEQVKNIKTGDAVSLKGVCSGSIFSEILGITSINFKRSTLNK